MIKRLYTLFVICIALSCCFSVADAQTPTVEIQAEPETPVKPTIGDTLRYRVFIRNAENVIGFRLTFFDPHLSTRFSVENWGEKQSGILNPMEQTFESSTQLIGVSIRNIFLLEFPDVSAGTGEIRVTGTLRIHPRAAVNPGRTVNVDVSLPITVSALAGVTPHPAEVVSIPDPNLAAAMRKALGLGANAPISKQAMQRLTKLDVINSEIKSGIKNLIGLEYATQLTELRLFNHQIRNISPLTGLTRLKRLDVERNQISNIIPLAGLTQLENLYLGANQINNQGVQRLSNLTQLKVLSLYGNQISNIKPLSNLTKLEQLHIADNQIRDVSPLAGLKNLEILYLQGNPIQDASPLAALRKLRHTDIDIPTAEDVVSIPDTKLAAAVRKALGLRANAPITDQAMQKLTRLDARESQIKNLTGLEHATRLEFLELRKNQITDIRPLTNLKRLKELILEVNKVRDIRPLANLTQLTVLYIAANPISDFTPLANLTNLRRLSLWDNNIDDNITLIANMSHLTHLHLWNSNISDITPLANLTQLKVLHLERNQIRNVSSLANLTQLEELTLRDNPIQDMAPLRTLVNRNPKLKLDIEIPPLSPVVHIDPAERPPLYWGDATTGTLHRLVGEEVENLVSTVKNATSLAVDMAGGTLYWTTKTNENRGKIYRINLNGTPRIEELRDLYGVPLDIAVDPQREKLYWIDALNRIQRADLNVQNIQNILRDLNAPKHITLDVGRGKLYWTEKTGNQTRKILSATLDGSNVQNVASHLSEPLSLAVANGKVYWTSARKLQRANLDGTNSGTLETLPSAPTSIAVDPARNSLYLTAPSGEIHRRDLDSSVSQPVVTSLVSPSNIVLGIRATPPATPNTPEPSPTPVVDAAADVNQDKKVNKTDLLLVVTALGEKPPANPNFDVNADGTVNIADVLLVIEALDDPVAAAAPALGETITALDPRQLAMQIDILRAESDGSMKYEHAIAFFQSLLASIRPSETLLLANYPNPFNPETWIPYQLAMPTEVTLRIYSVNGTLVRTVSLGHQPAGVYQSKGRAAYWDGTNELGEPVASGVYFYTLNAGEFTATRKLLIQK